MIKAVDVWAQRHEICDVIAQIGAAQYRPRALQSYSHVPPAQFAAYLQEADILVSHAGMGVILGALEFRKPLIIMPRRVELGEHRNNHQIATARKFKDRTGIYVAMDGSELELLLERRNELVPSSGRISGSAAPQLVKALRAFIVAD